MIAKWTLVVLGLVIVGCSGTPHQPLRVRVVDGAGQAIANATVVVGTPAGLVSTYQTTTGAGEVAFGSVPSHAVVTAALICTQASSGRTYHYLNAAYGVDQPVLTLTLGTCASNNDQVTITASNVVAGIVSNDVTLGPITYSGPTASIYVSSALQDDGKVSVFATGYDGTGNIVGNGYTLDQPAAQGTNIAVAIDRNDLVQNTHTLLNPPANIVSYYLYAMLMRQHALTSLPVNFAFGTTPLPATFTPYSDGNFSDNNMIGISVSRDLNNDGVADADVGFNRYLPTATDQTFDFASTPLIPGALSYLQGSSNRPTIAWSNPDAQATADTITLSYTPPAPSTNRYSFTLTVPATMTSVVFPELPAPLAALRPTAYSTLTLQTLKFDTPGSYGDYLQAIDTTRGRSYDASAFSRSSFAQVSRTP